MVVVRQVVPPEYAVRRRRAQLAIDRVLWAKRKATTRRAFGEKPLSIDIEVELAYSYLTQLLLRAMRSSHQLVREDRDGVKGVRLEREVAQTRSEANRKGWITRAQQLNRRPPSPLVSKVRGMIYGELSQHRVVAVADLLAKAVALISPEEAAEYRERFPPNRMLEDRLVANDCVRRCVASMVYTGAARRLEGGWLTLMREVHTVYSERSKAGWAVRRANEPK